MNANSTLSLRCAGPDRCWCTDSVNASLDRRAHVCKQSVKRGAASRNPLTANLRWHITSFCHTATSSEETLSDTGNTSCRGTRFCGQPRNSTLIALSCSTWHGSPRNSAVPAQLKTSSSYTFGRHRGLQRYDDDGGLHPALGKPNGVYLANVPCGRGRRYFERSCVHVSLLGIQYTALPPHSAVPSVVNTLVGLGAGFRATGGVGLPCR